MADITESALPSRQVEVLGRQMAVVEIGTGDPILFLHGNPTWSYLWRNVMPHLAARGRCLAPDLIGMGGSEKLDPSGADSYTFVEHRRYLDALLAALGVARDVTLVLHEWGGPLGFDWANRHRAAVRGIVYMEAIVRPLAWSDWPESGRELLAELRDPAGEDMVLQENLVVENILPGSVLRELTEAEQAAYRRPFGAAGEGRRPTLAWPRQVPLDGAPADVAAIVEACAAWMARNDLPKLFVNADPGVILTGAARDFCRGWSNQQEVTVPGLHFLQEDSPHAIGTAIAAWHSGLAAAA